MKLRKVVPGNFHTGDAGDVVIPRKDFRALLRVLRAAAKVLPKLDPDNKYGDGVDPDVAALDRAVRKFEVKK